MMKFTKIDTYTKGKIMKKNAFTMIELVIVIVVLGILASLALPRMERDVRYEAQGNLISALQYTQNLALSDNKTDPRIADWQNKLWHLRFHPYDGSTKWVYTISSDENQEGGVDKQETAIDPSNGKYMYNDTISDTIDSDESPNIFLTKQYGINSITLTGSCAANANRHIGFDHIGRPHADINNATNTYDKYLQTDCIITVGFETSGIANLVITVEAETGYISAI